MRPAEFCALQRQLIASMGMRKKRNVQMGPMQQLKLRLLERVQAQDPEPAAFTAVLARAVVELSPDGATGPAQAVASDLDMDWQLACQSEGFVAWLREAATRGSVGPSESSTDNPA
jgi:hypothetical protein